MMIITIITIII